MELTRLPGLAGEVQDHFHARAGTEGFDMALVRGAVIGVLSAVADGRCSVQHPPVFGPDQGDLRRSTPWHPTVVLFGSSGQPIMDEAAALLRTVGEGRLTTATRLRRSCEPVQGEDVLAAPTCGQVARSSALMTPGEVPPALVGRLRAVLRHPAASFITRMDDYAKEAFVETAQGWVQRDYFQFGEEVGDRIRRWMNVAALLVVEREHRVITYEVLRDARGVAVDDHDVATAMMATYKPVLGAMQAAENNVVRLH